MNQLEHAVRALKQGCGLTSGSPLARAVRPAYDWWLKVACGDRIERTLGEERPATQGNFWRWPDLRLSKDTLMTNVRRIGSRILRIIRSIQRYKNWMEIIGSENPRRLILRNGLQFELPRNRSAASAVDLVTEIFFKQVYFKHGLFIEPEDIVIDIGANIGVFTVRAAGATQNDVYAFEPFPESCKLVERNAQLNRLGNIHAYPLAVSDRKGTAKLYLAERNSGHLLYDHNIHGKLNQFTEVPTTTLEDIIERYKLNEIDFLKLDCEGAEGSILGSLSKSRSLSKIKKIAIEFHDNVSVLKHDEILELLKKSGFQTWIEWDGHSPFGYIFAGPIH